MHLLRGQSFPYAPDVQRPLAHPCVYQFRQLRRQRLGLPTHEVGVGIRSDVEAHSTNICLCTQWPAPIKCSDGYPARRTSGSRVEDGYARPTLAADRLVRSGVALYGL